MRDENDRFYILVVIKLGWACPATHESPRTVYVVYTYIYIYVLFVSQTWDDLPAEVKQIDEHRKLTFYLHVYYTLVECKHRVGKSDVVGGGDGKRADGSSMDAFRTFLLQRGAEFSTEPEFLPYFALPYVFEPMQHPSFKNLFKVSPVPLFVIP